MKIKIDFLFQWAPGWSNYESVLATLSLDENFICRVILLPFSHSGQIDRDNPEARAFLNDRQISWVWHEDYDYKRDKPDLVFIQNPYDFTRPAHFSCRTLKENNIKFAYIPYGLDVGEGETNLTFQYNMHCHNYATWIFVRSQQHKKFYKHYCGAGNKHVHVTGHPKFDSVHLWKKEVPGEPKVLLWTPHFQEGARKGWSTFNHYCDIMLFIALSYPVELIVRPHPLFIGRLKAFGGEAVEKFSRLVEYAKTCPNITLDFDSSYNHSFARADALMADAGSFILEYLPTEKPILYLTHKTCLGLNKSASFVHQSYYVAESEEHIDDFVKMILANDDPKKEKRLKALRDNFYIPPVSAADEIRQVLRKHFAVEVTRQTRFSGEQVEIDSKNILNFFEERAATPGRDPLTMTMYQSAELAAKRDAYEKALILPKLELSAGAQVLDIGCGNGRWYDTLCHKDIFYTGIDFSPSLIRMAQEKYNQHDRCEFYVEKANGFSSELRSPAGEKFSHVIISGVLMYLNNEEVTQVFTGLEKICEPGVLVFIREPVANEVRLTLKAHWSEELQSQYNAIYRTENELLSLISAVPDNLSLTLIESGEMFPDELNNRKETQQRYYIFKRK